MAQYVDGCNNGKAEMVSLIPSKSQQGVRLSRAIGFYSSICVPKISVAYIFDQVNTD